MPSEMVTLSELENRDERLDSEKVAGLMEETETCLEACKLAVLLCHLFKMPLHNVGRGVSGRPFLCSQALHPALQSLIPTAPSPNIQFISHCRSYDFWASFCSMAGLDDKGKIN